MKSINLCLTIKVASKKREEERKGISRAYPVSKMEAAPPQHTHKRTEMEEKWKVVQRSSVDMRTHGES